MAKSQATNHHKARHYSIWRLKVGHPIPHPSTGSSSFYFVHCVSPMEWPFLISPCIPMYPHVQTIQIHVIRIWNKRPSHEHPQSFGLGPWPPPGQLVACCLFSGAKDSLVTLACSKQSKIGGFLRTLIFHDLSTDFYHSSKIVIP